MTKITNYLLTEKYRPNNINDIVIPSRIKSRFSNGITHNIILAGPAGTGKTTSAKALVKEFNHPYLYINASSENGIDIVRDKITNFAANRSIIDDSNRIKVIILDEVDGASASFFTALRATIEEFHKTVRFICTCNFINKIPEPILSRFETITFEYSTEEETEIRNNLLKRIAIICKEENIKITKEAFLELIDSKFPDLRSILVSLQGLKSLNKDITIDDIKKSGCAYEELYKLIINSTDPVENYKFIVSNYANDSDDVLTSLGINFIEYLKNNRNDLIDLIPKIIIIVANYQSKRTFVIDPIINVLACIFELQQIIRK